MYDRGQGFYGSILDNNSRSTTAFAQLRDDTIMSRLYNSEEDFIRKTVCFSLSCFSLGTVFFD